MRSWQEAGQPAHCRLTLSCDRTIRSRSARRSGIPMSMREQSQSHQNHTTMDRDGYRRWRSSMVEQLICNQQVAGSSPIASSVERIEKDPRSLGRVPERSKGTDCKSVATGFEGSNPSPSTRTTTFESPTTITNERDQNAGVAQLVELQPSKLDVAGSRPVSRSNPTHLSPAHLAQLAEHVLGKDEVTRSIRVVGSTRVKPR